MRIKIGKTGVWIAANCLLAASGSLFAENLQPGALEAVGAYALQRLDPNLTGRSVTVTALCRSITYQNGMPLNDYLPNIFHDCFEDTTVYFEPEYNPDLAFSAHSTAIAGILAGRDPNAWHPELGQFTYQGAAPDAYLEIYEFWHYLSRFLCENRTPHADIVTLSVGTAFEEWWTRAFDAMTENSSTLVVAGIGNGKNAYDPILYPGAGANCLGVGVMDSLAGFGLETNLSTFILPNPAHTSGGLTVDWRIKPDIIAPANCLVPDANEFTGYSVCGDWSSFASPVVAGGLALLRQQAYENQELASVFEQPGTNCLWKAIVMNSADKLPYWHKGLLTRDDDHTAALDLIQGAGMMNLVQANRQLLAGPQQSPDVSNTGWDFNTMSADTEDYKSYRFNTDSDPNEWITITLAWNQSYQQQFPFGSIPEKNADLRLELWALHPTDPEEDYLIDYSDGPTGNIEHIHCRPDPKCTDYEIVVSRNTPEHNTVEAKHYALAWRTGKPSDQYEYLRYDIDADGSVNYRDIEAIFYQLDRSCRADEFLIGDLNLDGTISLEDVADLADYLSPIK